VDAYAFLALRSDAGTEARRYGGLLRSVWGVRYASEGERRERLFYVSEQRRECPITRARTGVKRLLCASNQRRERLFYGMTGDGACARGRYRRVGDGGEG
jgi:hypothetical protein